MFRKFQLFDRNDLRRFTTQVAIEKTHSSKWKSVIGLEVHAQIFANSKLFSRESTSFGEPLNSAVSFFDASIPGTLPVLNRKCVESAVRTALALGCRVNEVSMFDRKHYFYADMPSGFQITQQRRALANDGEFTFPVIVPGKKIYYKTVKLLQLQLEQDSGKSLHDEALKKSLVDLNRAGLPLMELVFGPDLETGEEAASLVKELVLILKRLRTCSCKMEEGALRVDANVSIHKESHPLGVRTEIKNINSIRSISQAITYEIKRQLAVIEHGEVVTNETRTWDALSRRTLAMRDKEVMQDYRFMPEPNLVPLRLNLSNTEAAKDLVSVPELASSLPELPESTRRYLIETYALNQDTAVILVNDPILLDHFLNVIKSLPSIPTKMITNFLINDLLTSCNKLNISVENCEVSATHIRDILKMLHAEEINLQSARSLIELLHKDPKATVSELIETQNLQQISDPDEIEALCAMAMKNQAKAVEQYKKGKPKAIFAIAGEVAKLSKQKANMKLVMNYLEKSLKL